MSKSAKKDKSKSKKLKKDQEVEHTLSASMQKRPKSPKEVMSERIIESEGQLLTYDNNLLERSRTQWQFGDWESLAQLDRNLLQHHPDRAKLVLLAAAGRLQLGTTEEARQYLALAQEWGCSSRLISQVLVAGVYNSLGRAAAIIGNEQNAMSHFSQAISLGTPGSDVRLLTQARVMQQYIQIGYPLPRLANGINSSNAKETSNNGEG